MSNFDLFIPQTASESDFPGFSRLNSFAVRSDGYVALGGYICESVGDDGESSWCSVNIPYAAVVDPSGATVLEFFPEPLSGVPNGTEVTSVSWQDDDLVATGDVCVSEEWEQCNGWRFFAARITIEGDVVWDIDLPHDEIAASWFSIAGMSDDHTAVFYRDSSGGDDSFARLISVDAAGAVEWSRSWPNESPHSIASLLDGTWIAAGAKMRGIDPTNGDVLWEWDAGPTYAVAPNAEFYTVDSGFRQVNLTRRDAEGNPYWELGIDGLTGALGVPACRGVVYLRRSEQEVSLTTHLVSDLGVVVDSETFVEPTDSYDDKGLLFASLASNGVGDVYVAPTFSFTDYSGDPPFTTYKTYLIRYRVTDDPDVSCSGPPPDDDADDDVDDDVAADDPDDDDGDDDDIGNLANDNVAESDGDDDNGCGC
ncbi:MAG: hypothetical protein KJ042_08260 [Deltaproteobacteria bacterium]|nr:hypothetical protein [Deltaproteobacteria bacterium]